MCLITQIQQQIENSDEWNVDDGDLRTTAHALGRAEYLFPAPVAERFLMLSGALYGDGDGGLRGELVCAERRVTVVIHGSRPEQSYIYHQAGDVRGSIETALTPEKVDEWLRWIEAPRVEGVKP